MSLSAGMSPSAASTPVRDRHEPINPLDGRALRQCLSRFSTGVTVVSYEVDGEPRGATMNAFTSVSLDPPLILLSVARTARACDALEQTPFAVNILRANQRDVALQFAGRPQRGAALTWRRDTGRAPALAGTVAVLQCRPWARYDGGDHVLQLGEVIEARHEPGEPLLFVGGDFSTAGLPLYDTPRVLDNWVDQARHLHDIAGA